MNIFIKPCPKCRRDGYQHVEHNSIKCNCGFSVLPKNTNFLGVLQTWNETDIQNEEVYGTPINIGELFERYGEKKLKNFLFKCRNGYVLEFDYFDWMIDNPYKFIHNHVYSMPYYSNGQQHLDRFSDTDIIGYEERG